MQVLKVRILAAEGLSRYYYSLGNLRDGV